MIEAVLDKVHCKKRVESSSLIQNVYETILNGKVCVCVLVPQPEFWGFHKDIYDNSIGIDWRRQELLQ